MSLSFFHPLFWLGALTVAAPIYLHLRRKQPRDLMLFSTLRFLDDQPQARQSPLRPRDLLLLALRILALLALVAAFAWPFLNKGDRIVVKESRVYILDNTLSHQVDGGFATDRDRLLRELAQAGREVQIAVIELTTSPRVVAAFGEDRESARLKLRQLEPSFERGSYYAAFRQAATLLANSLGAKKRIVLLGDNQENQWGDNQSSPPFLEGVDVDIPRVNKSANANLSLSDPRAQRIFAGDRSMVNFTAQITRQGPIPAARVVFRVNGQELQSHVVDLTSRPENFTFQTEWEADPALALNCELSVDADGDALAADNHLYYSLPAEHEGTVAVLAQSQFLKIGLSPEVMRGHWAARFIDAAQIGAAVESTDDAEVLCIESNYLQSDDARRLVARYLDTGRGVLIMVNRLSPASKAYLKELGFEAQDSAKPGRAHFQYIFASHPVLYPFTLPDYGNLMEVEVTDPFSLRAAQAIPLIFTDKGEAVLLQKAQSKGRLMVQAFAFDRRQTTWPVHVTFLPYLDLCLQNLRPVDPAPTVFEPSSVMTRTFPTNSGVRALVLKGDTELGRAAVENGRVKLKLPAKPGFYTVACEGGNEPARTLCINPSHKESELRYTNQPATLQSWVVPRVIPRNEIASSKGPAPIASILQERLWWWLLIAALAGFACETCIANFKRRKS